MSVQKETVTVEIPTEIIEVLTFHGAEVSNELWRLTSIAADSDGFGELQPFERGTLISTMGDVDHVWKALLKLVFTLKE